MAQKARTAVGAVRTALPVPQWGLGAPGRFSFALASCMSILANGAAARAGPRGSDFPFFGHVPPLQISGAGNGARKGF